MHIYLSKVSCSFGRMLTYADVYIYVCMCAHIYISKVSCAFGRMLTYADVCWRVYIYICTCICVHIYTYRRCRVLSDGRCSSGTRIRSRSGVYCSGTRSTDTLTPRTCSARSEPSSTSRYSISLLYWYLQVLYFLTLLVARKKRTLFSTSRYSISLLYWYKSTLTGVETLADLQPLDAKKRKERN
jgi:hypothetical protein